MEETFLDKIMGLIVDIGLVSFGLSIVLIFMDLVVDVPKEVFNYFLGSFYLPAMIVFANNKVRGK